LAGDVLATFVTRPGSAVSLTSASIAGTLGGNWDLNGAVGTVAANHTSAWSLGISGNQAASPSGTGVTAAGSLALGQAANVSIDVGGAVTKLTAVEWNGGSLRAGSVGTLALTGGKVVGSTSSVTGDLSGVTIHVTGATATGVALATLGVA